MPFTLVEILFYSVLFFHICQIRGLNQRNIYDLFIFLLKKDPYHNLDIKNPYFLIKNKIEVLSNNFPGLTLFFLPWNSNKAVAEIPMVFQSINIFVT